MVRNKIKLKLLCFTFRMGQFESVFEQRELQLHIKIIRHEKHTSQFSVN